MSAVEAARALEAPRTARGWRDIREHIAELERTGRLVRVTREINKDTELHPLVRWQFRGLAEAERKVFLFENVVDSRGRRYGMPVIVGALAASEDVYVQGLASTHAEAFEKWKHALAHPIDPVLVSAGPCQEVVHSGDGLLEHGGLDELPVPISTPGFDNAPYLNSAIFVIRDPETGIRNAAVYRGQLKGQLRTGVFCDSFNNGGVIWEKCNRLGIPLEAAAVIGAAPAVYYGAINIAALGVDELTIAGGIAGEPIELVKCRTIDLEVPATAEIVLEGRIRTDVLEPEGSFGEAHGYCDPRSLSFAFEISAITHRRDPIFLSILSQLTPSESSKTKQTGHQTELLRFLRDRCGLRGVQRVALHEDLLNRQLGVVVLRKTDKYEPMNALYALLTIRQTPKILVAVDEDIDPESTTMVLWAIVNRSQPHKHLTVVHPRKTQFGPLRYVQHGDGYDDDDSTMLIDATRKADFPPVALPAREHMERARRLWEELGLPELSPRTPWHGYSLGMWSDENREEAELATQGRYYETGEKLALRRRAVPQGTRLAEIRRHEDAGS
jgi:4-hydroxy-3-polyprenylbenzoate decarboxylase